MSTTDFDELLAEADEAFRLTDYNKTHDILKVGEKKKVSNEKTKVLWGKLHFEMDRIQDSRKLFKSTLSKNPLNIDAHLGIIKIYLKEKRPKSIIKHCNRVLKECKNDASILAKLGEAYIMIHEFKKGFHYYDRAIKKTVNDYIQWDGIAQSLLRSYLRLVRLRLYEIKTGIKVSYSKVKDDEYPEIWVNKYINMLERRFVKLINCLPMEFYDDFHCKRSILEFYENSESNKLSEFTNDIITTNSKEIEIGNANPKLYLLSGIANAALENYEEAIENLKMVLQLNKNILSTYYILAGCYREINDPKREKDIILKGIDIYPTSIKIWETYMASIMGVIIFDGEVIPRHNHEDIKSDSILDSIESGLTKNPRSPTLQFYKSLQYSMMDSDKKALKAINGALTFEPLNTIYIRRKARTFGRLDRYRDSIDLYNYAKRIGTFFTANDYLNIIEYNVKSSRIKQARQTIYKWGKYRHYNITKTDVDNLITIQKMDKLFLQLDYFLGLTKDSIKGIEILLNSNLFTRLDFYLRTILKYQELDSYRSIKELDPLCVEQAIRLEKIGITEQMPLLTFRQLISLDKENVDAVIELYELNLIDTDYISILSYKNFYPELVKFIKELNNKKLITFDNDSMSSSFDDLDISFHIHKYNELIKFSKNKSIQILSELRDKYSFSIEYYNVSSTDYITKKYIRNLIIKNIDSVYYIANQFKNKWNTRNSFSYAFNQSSQLFSIYKKIGRNYKNIRKDMEKLNGDANSLPKIYNTLKEYKWKKNRISSFIDYLIRHGENYNIAYISGDINILDAISEYPNFNNLLMYAQETSRFDGIGVRGQLKLLLGLIDLATILCKLKNTNKEIGNSLISHFVDILTVQKEVEKQELMSRYRSVDSFIARHPSIKDDTIDLMQYYNELTDGANYTSKFIEKEDRLLQKGEIVRTHFEKKFITALRKKVELLRYNIIMDKIEKFYFALLEDILGDVDIELDFQPNRDIINIIIAIYSLDEEDNNKELWALKKILTNSLLNVSDNSWIYSIEENMEFDTKLSKGYNLEKWREGLVENHNILSRVDIGERLDEINNQIIDEICLLFDKLGIQVSSTIHNEPSFPAKAQIIKSALERMRKQIHPEQLSIYNEINIQSNNLQSNIGQLAHKGGRITFYVSQDPVESLNMATGFPSCLKVEESTYLTSIIANTIHINKNIIYAKDENGRRIGRVLAVLTDKGILIYRFYENTNLNLAGYWLKYLYNFGKTVKADIFIPKTFAQEERNLLTELETNYNTQIVNIEHTIQLPVFSEWYDDIKLTTITPKNNLYKIKVECYRISI